MLRGRSFNDISSHLVGGVNPFFFTCHVTKLHFGKRSQSRGIPSHTRNQTKIIYLLGDGHMQVFQVPFSWANHACKCAFLLNTKGTYTCKPNTVKPTTIILSVQNVNMFLKCTLTKRGKSGEITGRVVPIYQRI